MRRTECEEFGDLLLRRAAGKLDEEGHARLERHVEGCVACREAAAGLANVWEALGEWEAAPLSADFDRRLYRKIEAEVSWWDRLRLPLSGVLLRRGLPVAAAAGLALVAGLVMERSGDAPFARERAVLSDPIRPEQADAALEQMEMLQQFNVLVRPDSPDPRM